MNKFKNILQVSFLLFGIIIISGCGDVDEMVIVEDIVEKDVVIVENDKSCKIDSDCVSASCCHANDVVNKKNAPSCDNLRCTLSCETILDCGQGRPVCNNGQCQIEKSIDGNLRVEEIDRFKNEVEIN